jgi:hypothetical protein
LQIIDKKMGCSSKKTGTSPTSYSRIGPFGPRSARGISRKRIQADTPARLIAQAQPGTSSP